MKRLYTFLSMALLCLLLASCAGAGNRFSFTPTVLNRTNAVIRINETSKSQTDVPDIPPAVTHPTYFEVIAARTTSLTSESSKEPEITLNPEATTAVTTKKPEADDTESFIVKFVDVDGYNTISVQNVKKGSAANEPAMPTRRNGTIFVGWDKNFSNVQQSMVVRAIYQKEWLTVRFFDADGTLLKTEKVYYGESASAPHITDKGKYLFAGWDQTFYNVTRDLDVYATYYIPEERSYTTLADAFRLMPVKENENELAKPKYYRREYGGTCTVGGKDYKGNILYGNFSDTIDISGFGFVSLEGIVALKPQSPEANKDYMLNLAIYVDSKIAFRTTLTRVGASKSFKIDLKDAKSITIVMETTVDGNIYHEGEATPKFIGGLIDTLIYEN